MARGTPSSKQVIRLLVVPKSIPKITIRSLKCFLCEKLYLQQDCRLPVPAGSCQVAAFEEGIGRLGLPLTLISWGQSTSLCE